MAPVCFGSIRTHEQPQDKQLVTISSGGKFVCGLEYGNHFPICWGSLEAPQSFLNVSYTAISSGASHACAIRSYDNRADCWGSINSSTVPNQDFVSISSGSGFSCGLTLDGATACWGEVPGAIPKPANDKKFMALFAGAYVVCGITAQAGETLCWGGEKSNPSPAIPPPGLKFSYITGGFRHTCGVRADNHQTVCWGDNRFAQLRVPENATFSAISAGDFYTCGVRLDRAMKILCWGNSGVLKNEDFNASQGVCTSRCGKNQYELHGSTSCPSLSDKVCLDCSICVGDNVEISPCGDSFDRKCGKLDITSGVEISKSWRRIMFVLYVTCFGAAAMGILVYLKCGAAKFGKINDSGHGVVCLSASELQAATNNYCDDSILGKGSFATVYKGVLHNGRQVAIKQAKASTRGTLHDNLYSSHSLEWTTRIKISAQAARGLEYLHRYVSPSVTHRDVKSSNILLDCDWNAKVSDFGLSVCGPQDNATHLSNLTIVGTPGYLDPDYGNSSQLTTTSDVYSFGVVLLELMSGQKPIDLSREIQSLVAWVLDLVERDEWSSVLDARLAVPLEPEPLYRAVKLALECTKASGKERPSMSHVAKTLEEVLEAVVSPQTCAFSSVQIQGEFLAVSSWDGSRLPSRRVSALHI
ncbi:serine/threonine-protein kinase-like protein CR4 [Selaginella moellendorffii]|uniref:serine/threonine-protein kinase-like protein CR4 n=1 Tax=Selaginella moellendorffii TaxID=88036 RepID=UPI000D1CCC3F|nr:serine/threonine-protein kinase-like protein CR4 [Selaginella moellendorffii]|eukprot:XP_024523018.1 serine/threonine-protein kinase-like protein CR4 [Selaginella moellendorffii]